MKRSLTIFAAALLAAITFTATYFRLQHGRVFFDSDRAGFMLLKGNFRAWYIIYSHGQQLQPDGSWKNLWRRPTFRHIDMSNFVIDTNRVANRVVIGDSD